MRHLGLTLLVGGLLSGASAAQAGPITFDTWYQFRFDGVGSPATACTLGPCASIPGTSFASAPPWTYTGTYWSRFTVTDAFTVGDAFNVFDFGVPLGSTPLVAASGSSCGADPNACIADPLVSHATFVLSPGAHSITISTRATVQPAGGTAYFRATTPEPGVLVLLGLGLVGLRLIRRRSR